ncbi:MAG TPA: metallopeptidase TldD-related protein [Gemmatimonadales bacterium]|nr:metallopeptidase TldD-related protein [Gemmatimonadales bacterium]
MLLDLLLPTRRPPDELLLSREACRDIAARTFRLRRGPGELRVGVQNSWRGTVRWGRNRITGAADRRAIVVLVQSAYGISRWEVTTSRTDDEGLGLAVDDVERLMQDGYAFEDTDPLPPRRTDFPRTVVWSDATVRFAPDQRAGLAERLVQPVAAAGLSSAGYLSVGADVESWFGQDGEASYCTRTSSECSLTVRDAKSNGSGWAAASSYDWSRLDPEALAARARTKCETSRQPSAVEPGRYTVVLEPQAVGDLLELVVDYLYREPAEQGFGPFADPKRPGFSKLGQRLLDSRIDLTFDPVDPELGVCPFDSQGEPLTPAKWFQHGVLTALAYGRRYGVNNFNRNQALPFTPAIRMSGGSSTVDEMIASTRRGLLVTRFSGATVLDHTSLLSTGHTRDGLWLIENGKVTRPVKNFRFTDSPLFLFNSVESLGTPVPVFRPRGPMIVPPLKASSFNFTRLVDAV